MTMRARSLHPGVSTEDVSAKTGFEVHFPCSKLAVSRSPTAQELEILEELDPGSRVRGSVKT